MSSPSVLQRLGSTAGKYVSGLKTLPPGESEMQGIKAAQQNVDAAAAAAKPEPMVAPAAKSGPPELLHPMAKYGDRPGEKRLDSEGNVLKAPAYDCGGDVKIQSPMMYDQGGDVNTNPNMRSMQVKAFDNGGEVDVNDGQHQLAVLKDGEKVLDPKEAEAYRAGQKNAAPETSEGAPADFGGRVFPNPNNVQPVADTDIKPEVERLSGGATMNTDNAPVSGDPNGDVTNPLAADISAKIPAESDKRGPQPSAKETRDESYAGEQIKPAAPDPTITEAGMKENGTHPSQQAAPVQMQKGTEAERKAIAVDKQQAMGQGIPGLVKLGLANIHENQLEEQPSGSMEQGAKAPAELNQGNQGPGQGTEQGATPPAAMARPAGPGMPQMNVPEAAPAAAPGATSPVPMDRKAKIADYDKKIQAALDTATPEGKELADRLSYAKQAYEHHTPLGSEENHPGFMGKLGHVLGKVGNIAGDIVAPSAMSLIPGTDLNNRVKQAGLQNMTAQDTASATARAAEEATAASTKNEGTPQQQYIDDQRTLRAAQEKGDPKAIAAAQAAVDADAKAAELGKVTPAAKEATPENRLADANMALQAAQKSGDPNAIAKAQGDVKAITDAILAGKGTAATAPATPEDVKDYQTRIGTVLSAMPDGPAKDEAMKTYGTAPTGTTKAELDKRFDEASKMRTMGDTEAQTKVANQARDDAAAAKKVEEAGKVFDKYNTQLEKIKTPTDATSARANLVIHNLDLRTKQADSLVAPEILTLAAGGQGSGLRMNEAEISRIVGGRSAWDGLVAHANKIKQEGGTFDDNQRGQLRKIAEYIAERSAATSSVLDVARDNMLASQGDEAATRKAYSDGNRVASAIQRKGIIPEGGVRSPGDYVMFNGQVMIVDAKGKGHPALEAQQ